MCTDRNAESDRRLPRSGTHFALPLNRWCDVRCVESTDSSQKGAPWLGRSIRLCSPKPGHLPFARKRPSMALFRLVDRRKRQGFPRSTSSHPAMQPLPAEKPSMAPPRRSRRPISAAWSIGGNAKGFLDRRHRILRCILSQQKSHPWPRRDVAAGSIWDCARGCPCPGSRARWPAQPGWRSAAGVQRAQGRMPEANVRRRGTGSPELRGPPAAVDVDDLAGHERRLR
jgi:hypothetical protein